MKYLGLNAHHTATCGLNRKRFLNKLLELLTGLLTLKQGPQDAPAQSAPFLLAYMFTGLAQVAAAGVKGWPAVILLLGDVTLLCAGVTIFLLVMQKPARWRQVLSSLCLVGVFFNVLAMVLISVLPCGTSTEPSPVLAMAGLLLMAWSAAAGGNILRHAGEFPLGLGIIIFVVFQLVALSVLPAPPADELCEQRNAVSQLFNPEHSTVSLG